jgi:predicted glycosyltransferase involved in capsule biosynthesis
MTPARKKNEARGYSHATVKYNTNFANEDVFIASNSFSKLFILPMTTALHIM